MTSWTQVQLIKQITEVRRRLDVLAFNIERDNPETAAEIRDLYQDLDDAIDTFVFGRPLKQREMV